MSAAEIALERLGRPLPNAVLLGLITLVAVAHAIGAKFGSRAAESNVAAATEKPAPSRRTSCRNWLMLKQIEGSKVKAPRPRPRPWPRRWRCADPM